MACLSPSGTASQGGSQETVAVDATGPATAKTPGGSVQGIESGQSVGIGPLFAFWCVMLISCWPEPLITE